MAKFSFDDADDDPPAATTSGGDKRKREGGGPSDAEDCGVPRKARILAAGGGGPDGSAAVTEDTAGGSGGWRMVEAVGGDADGAISVRIDPEVLDCSICFEPFRPPLYQCQNGHVACVSCWSKLSYKCHICCHEANFVRNIALEKIVESVKSSCSYANWGCSELVSYSLKDAHEKSCLFAPSVCPIPGCGYSGFTGWWSGHFFINHSGHGLRFLYDQCFEVELEMSVPFLVLLAEDDHLFLLLNKNVVSFGHALSVICLRKGSLNWNFLYEIKAASSVNTENNLQLKASVTNTREWGGVHPTEAFLLVPYSFCKSNKLTLHLSIERIVDVRVNM